MIEQTWVCDGHTYKSVVYKCENRVSSENGFGKENTSALNISQIELSLVSLFSNDFYQMQDLKSSIYLCHSPELPFFSVYHSLLKY